MRINQVWFRRRPAIYYHPARTWRQGVLQIGWVCIGWVLK